MGRLSRVFSLAKIILKDGLKRHAIIGLLLFALVANIGGLLFFDFFPRDIGRVSNDFLLSIAWVSGLIFLLFHCVQTVVWDDEHKSIHTFLARPISRTEYMLGVFVGLAVLLFILNTMLGLTSWGILNLIKNSVKKEYFDYLSSTFFLVSFVGIYLIELIILSVIILFSSLIRGKLPVLLITLSYYFTCTGLPVVRESFNNKMEITGESSSLNFILKYASAIFPDFSHLDFKLYVMSPVNTPGLETIFSVFSLSVIYVVIFLFISAYFYDKRDIG